MKNLAFILLHIDDTVSSAILDPIIEISNLIKDKKFVIFNSYNTYANCSLPIFHINQLKFFKCDVVVFDIISLVIAVSCYKIRNIYYYSYNIPWTIDNTTNYEFWAKLFDNDKVKIITQNKDIYDTYNKVWKRPIAISQEILSDEFIKIIQ